MKATAIAPANIAFVKYWGKRDQQLNIPMNDSISMNLSRAFTTTSVEFGVAKDVVEMGGKLAEGKKRERVLKHVDRIAEQLGIERKPVKIVTENSFPSSAGIASSASGFAALTLATVEAFGQKISEKELSIFARQGSGSACRSIPHGFVKWQAGAENSDSFAFSLYPAEYWKIHDIVVIFGQTEKNVSSSEGHHLAPTSPLFDGRLRYLPKTTSEIERALGKKDMEHFGELMEAEALNMHAVMMTSHPPLLYWEADTVRLMKAIWQWRTEGLAVYFTIDAGPNIHVICEDSLSDLVLKKISEFSGITQVIDNVPVQGARLITG